MPLPNGDDFVVKVDSVKDLSGKDIYKPTQEEDVNVFDGDVRMPQENYPLPASDVQPGATTAPDPGQGGPVSQTPGIVSACAGANHPVHVTDQGLMDARRQPVRGSVPSALRRQDHDDPRRTRPWRRTSTSSPTSRSPRTSGG